MWEGEKGRREGEGGDGLYARLFSSLVEASEGLVSGFTAGGEEAERDGCVRGEASTGGPYRPASLNSNSVNGSGSSYVDPLSSLPTE